MDNEEKAEAEMLKAEFIKLRDGPPFNGKVSHRTRAQFLAQWKALVESKGVKGANYVNNLIELFRRDGQIFF